MSARKKLNGMYVSASAVFAAFVGAVFGSWWAFIGVLVLALGTQLMAGNIRFASPRR